MKLNNRSCSKSYLLLLMIAMHIVVFAKEPIVLSGKFSDIDTSHLDYYEIEISYASYHAQDQERITLYPDINGEFTVLFNEGLSNQLVNIKIGDLYLGMLFINEGLHITINSKRILRGNRSDKTIAFSGPDSGMCREINRFYKKQHNTAFYNARADIVFRSEKNYEQQLKELEELYASFKLKQEKKLKPFSSSTKKLLKDEFLAMYSQDVLLISLSHEIPADLIQRIVAFKPNHSSIYTFWLNKYLHYHLNYRGSHSFTSTIRAANKGLVNLDELEIFLDAYEQRQAKKPFDNEIYQSGYKNFIRDKSEVIYSINLNYIIDTIQILGIDTPDYILAAALPDNIESRKICYAKTYDLLQTQWGRDLYDWRAQRDEEDRKTITEMKVVQVRTSYLGDLIASNNQQKLYVAKHDSIAVLLEDIKEEYTGKIVIIDFWATWCGPCIADMKKSSSSKSELKANNVEVIYFCEGEFSQQDQWTEKTVHLKTTGSHVYLSSHLTKQFRDKFELNYYPSYLIKDANGVFHVNKINSISKANAKKIAAKYGVAE